MKPIVDGLAQRYGNEVEFRTLDVDEQANRQTVVEQRVSGIPTYVFIDANGAVVDRVVGGMDASTFEAKVKSLLSP